LATSRIVLISSAGGYLAQEQAPFDAANPYGDYSIRTFSLYTAFDQIAYAHDHYDHTAVNADPQVLLPLRHLNDLEEENWLGDIAPQVISFMGYQPDVSRLLDETIPAIIAAAQATGARGALLVPA
jgi:Glycine/sarcosine/betaine reductase selenoprotein B (GRDB)